MPLTSEMSQCRCKKSFVFNKWLLFCLKKSLLWKIEIDKKKHNNTTTTTTINFRFKRQQVFLIVVTILTLTP